MIYLKFRCFFLPRAQVIRLLRYKAMKMSKVTTELLIRFFENRTTSYENDMIADWIESSPDNQETFNRELRYHLMLIEASSLPDGRRVSSRPFSVRHRIAAAAGMAAAFLVGAFLVWSLAMKPLAEKSSQMLSFVTEPGQRASVTLPDGTSVELNSATVLQYPAVFSGKERRVRIDGEAMFDVTSDSRRPFFVETFAYDVKVLGTKFNVEADEDRGVFSTALIEGRVAVLDKQETQLAQLEPDQELTLSDGVLVKRHQENIESRYRWTDGIINCVGLSFEELMRKFEKTFGVHIVIERENVPDISYKRMKVNVRDGISHSFSLLQRSSDFVVDYDDTTNTYYIR